MMKLVISDIKPPEFGSFGEADQPWTPRYVDVLKQYDTTAYGFDALEIDAQYATLTASRSRIKQLFEGRYMYRRISAETLPRWQTRLQQRMDELCAQYDREMALYAKVTVDKAVTGGTTSTRTAEVTPDLTDTTTYGRTTTDSGQDVTAGRSIDTPQTDINHSDGYADSLQEDTTTYGKTSSHGGSDSRRTSGKTTTTETVTTDDVPEGGLMIATREACDAWEDLCVKLVREFENLFLNVFDY